MATAPSGYTAGAPVNGVIPLYNSASGLIAGTMQNGKTNLLGSDATAAQSAALANFPHEIGVSGTGSAPDSVTANSYLSPSGGQTGSGNMTWNDITNAGYSPS